AVGHAAGELEEALRENPLAAVAADDAGIECDAGERRVGHGARDALGHRLALEVLEPAIEGHGVAARRRTRRPPEGANQDDGAQPSRRRWSHHRPRRSSKPGSSTVLYNEMAA